MLTARRIVHTIRSISPETGGPSYSVPALCLALQRAGALVELWVQDGPIDGAEEIATKRVRRADLQSSISEMKRQSPDALIHDHGLWLPWNHAVAHATRRSAVARVVSPRGMLEPWAINFRAWKKKIAWRTYQKADLESASLLHATAMSEAANLRSYGLTVPIAVAPNGVDASLSYVATHRSDKAEKTALFLSRIHPKKGLLDLVKAWSRLRPPGWRVRIIGPDENGHRREVADEVTAAGLERVITFHDQISGPDKWREYSEADLFVLPSYSENFGLVVAEALCAGLPVIATHAMPWAELESEKCGWWIPTGTDSLEHALRRATELTSEERKAMGQSGRKMIEQRYTWSAVAQKMLEYYEHACSGQRRR